MDLVIGGSGFIGSHIVNELMHRGNTVRVYDRAPFPSDEAISPTEMVEGDILDFHKLSDAMEGCDRVFHLAAIPQLWHRDLEIFDAINRQGTENVIQAAKNTQIKQLIYTSTESILVPRNHEGLITEETQPHLGDMIGPYCRSKFLAEQAVFRCISEGFPALVISPTLPIGQGDRNLTPPAQMILNFLQGKIPAYIDCIMNYVDVKDAALGHLLAAEKGRIGRRYILAGHNVTLEEFFSLLGRVINRPAPKYRIPHAVALAFSYVDEFIGKMNGRTPRSSVTGVKLCKRSLAFDGSKTWQHLGHSPRPLEESIREAVSWHLQRLSKLNHTKMQ